MTKIYKIFILVFFLLIIGTSTTRAEELNRIIVDEIGSNFIKGSYSGQHTILVYNGESLLGQGKGTANTYHIQFGKAITSGSKLTIKVEESETDVIYNPAVLNKVDDKSKAISGKALPGAKVTATVRGKALPIKSQNTANGNFEFKPSSLLKYRETIHVITTIDGIKSILTTQVTAASPPSKPKLNTLTNKTNYISGSVEPYSVVNLLVGKARYTVRASSTGYFKRYLPNKKPFPAGTLVKIYVSADRYYGKSGTIAYRVADKIPPAVPRVNKITNKSFIISGMTESNSTIYVLRNNRLFKTVKAAANGRFSLKVPLQSADTKFVFYAKDSAGNQGAKKQVAVTNQKRPDKKLMNAPLIRQMPELPRGCEVTSLAMMLNQAGVKANKMTLAKQVKKDPTIYRFVNGKHYFGNPHYGFVGDMYTFSKPGFGVYNKPIAELANKYMPGKIVNLSGQSFESVLDYVAAGRPVWVINTSWFSYVPSKYWQTWYTPQGPVRITKKEHSVLITGYDSKYIYFNDPLDGTKNKKRLKKHFIEGWTQFGKQAISYY